MNWDNHRREDGTINLVSAYNARYDHWDNIDHWGARDYLQGVEGIQLCRSRQNAALAIATALALYKRREPQSNDERK